MTVSCLNFRLCSYCNYCIRNDKIPIDKLSFNLKVVQNCFFLNLQPHLAAFAFATTLQQYLPKCFVT